MVVAVVDGGLLFQMMGMMTASTLCDADDGEGFR